MKRGMMTIPLVVLALSGLPAAQAKKIDDVYTAVRTNNLARVGALIQSTADTAIRDDRGMTPLMYAAGVGSMDAMKFLIEKGADVNAQSETGLTALILGASDLAKTRLLLDRGVKVNATTKLGRTALFIAAMNSHSADVVRLLVQKGADVNMTDAFKNTMLTAAAAGNDIDTIRLMIEAGVDVNGAAATGLTPLMLAAGQKNVQAVKMLLAKGANVNAVGDPFMTPGPPIKAGPAALFSYTPLLMAAAFGPPDLIQMLLDAGANVNATESRKLTPLMLAVAADHQEPGVIRLLLARGADPTLRSATGETAADWATKVGASVGIDILHAPRPQPAARSENAAAPLDLRTAVERSVALLEKSSQGFFAGSGCVSCHAQSITDLAVAEARAKGARADAKATEQRLTMLRTNGVPIEVLYERMDIRVPEIVAYPLAGLAAAEYPPDRLTDAMAVNIAVQQSPDGAWHVPFGVQQRPGGEDGDIFRTALSIRSLKVYGPPGRGAEMQARITKARQWLTTQAKPVTAEDHSMQLLGSYWAGSDQGVLKRLAKEILAAQQSDGGWQQREGLASDAYGTGESLYALAKAGGVPPSDSAYQKGLRYLLATQRTEDGSWRVRSRTPKFQVFFQSGFPYAGDQWISQWATGWATMALAQALEPSSPARAAR